MPPKKKQKTCCVFQNVGCSGGYLSGSTHALGQHLRKCEPFRLLVGKVGRTEAKVLVETGQWDQHFPASVRESARDEQEVMSAAAGSLFKQAPVVESAMETVTNNIASHGGDDDGGTQSAAQDTGNHNPELRHHQGGEQEEVCK